MAGDAGCCSAPGQSDLVAHDQVWIMSGDHNSWAWQVTIARSGEPDKVKGYRGEQGKDREESDKDMRRCERVGDR